MLSLEADGRRLASCSTDATVCIWDARSLGKGCKAAHTLAHSKSCQGAAWAPDGSGRLLTTCYDDTLRIWDGLAFSGAAGGAKGAGSGASKPKAALSVKHNCNTGRWIVPFRAIWVRSRASRRAHSRRAPPKPALRSSLTLRACPRRLLAGAQTPGSDGVVVGSMQRQMHLLDAASGKLAKAYESELMTAIPARNAAHPCLPVLAGGTASGRAHIFSAE